MQRNNFVTNENGLLNFDVVIEIANGSSVKYEMDEEGILRVDRFLNTAMHYPCKYGYVPQTLCGDGDALDALVLTRYELLPGAVITVRALGMLQMEDEKGEDHKLLTVPISKLDGTYDKYRNVQDIDANLLKEIEHFFSHYKDLEVNKWVKIKSWLPAKQANDYLLACLLSK